MCGIFGIVSTGGISILDGLERLKRLEYRGYDSAGFVTDKGLFMKTVGSIDNLIRRVQNHRNVRVFIGHTRWATHGRVTDVNAHPHLDCTGNIFVVHNGTIENYEELKNYLIKQDHIFRSETDSEIFAHWFEEGLKRGKSISSIVKEIFKLFDGTFATLIYIKNMNKIVGMKKGSPLIVGKNSSEIYIASDVYAFLDRTNEVYVLEDGEWFLIDLK